MAFSYDQNRCRGVWEDDDAKNIDVQDEVDTNEDIHSKKKLTNLTSAKLQLTIESFRSPVKDVVRTKKGTFLQSLARP